jgi:hypothetical protein
MYWYFSGTDGSPGVLDDTDAWSACVAFEAQITRPFVAADSATDMTIYADPDNSGGYATTYTFRAQFGPAATN